jgi:signal transduction histidine kinase
MQTSLKRPSVLIVSDETDFAHAIVARWQSERVAAEITLVTSDIWHAAGAAEHDLVVVGFVRSPDPSLTLSVLSESAGKPTIYVTADASEIASLHFTYPHLVVVERRDEWNTTLILLANEILRRVEALGRAHRAESLAIETLSDATLGRYMLDMRPNINNALTSVLGYADLLLLEPGQAVEERREQIQTIHTMALRLNEIMHRFSSLACEMRVGERKFQPEAMTVAGGRVSKPDERL